jgi:hypothetical protein
MPQNHENTKITLNFTRFFLIKPQVIKEVAKENKVYLLQNYFFLIK